MNNLDIKKVVEKYLELFKDEESDLAILNKQLSTEESVIGRGNSFGHVTASGIILKGEEILLIFHNRLQKYIQPGGHVEGDKTLYESAKREVLEETGIDAALHPWHTANGFIPIDIDTHKIPANTKKDESKHFHHDFAFVFQVSDDKVILQEEEVSGYKWVPLNSDFQGEHLEGIKNKISTLGIQKF